MSIDHGICLSGPAIHERTGLKVVRPAPGDEKKKYILYMS